ncbi:hypothetical protein D3C75_710960 [compost metagenome]
MEWKDVTRYAKGERGNVTPRAWGTDLGSVDMTILRHDDYPPDVWLLRCNYLCVSRVLASKKLEDARAEALNIVKAQMIFKRDELQRNITLLEEA